eukprot:2835640-Pleurochrysis_carterae.AAC.1
MALYPASCMRLAEREEATEEGILEPLLEAGTTNYLGSRGRDHYRIGCLRAISPGEEGDEGSRSAAGVDGSPPMADGRTGFGHELAGQGST